LPQNLRRSRAVGLAHAQETEYGVIPCQIIQGVPGDPPRMSGKNSYVIIYPYNGKLPNIRSIP